MVSFNASEFFVDRVLYELVGHLVIATTLGILYFYTRKKILGFASLVFLIFFFVRLAWVIIY